MSSSPQASLNAGFTETFRGVVHPWHCDAMGHVNVRHYMAIFDDAAFQLLGMIAGGAQVLGEECRGWADVRHTIEYGQELRPGALIVVRSGVSRIGTSSLTVMHRMVGAIDERSHATMEAVTVLFDLAARRALPLTEELRAAATKLMVQP